MNQYETLYQIKQDIEEKVSKNKLFKLSILEATRIVLEKVGVFFRVNLNPHYDRKQAYLKKLAKTNETEIEEISFIQESIKWIFRWCAKYCSSESQIETNEVVANDIFDLMGTAYSYDKFNRMWELHNAKKTKYYMKGNKVTFDYKNNDVYKVHVFYDSYHRKLNIAKQVQELRYKDINHANFIQNMNNVHQTDFTCTFNIEFDGFNLEDYKKFSTSLNEIVSRKMIKNADRNNNYIIIPGEEGVLCLTREEWIKNVSLHSKLTYEKVEKIINFFTLDFSNQSSDISLSYFVSQSDNHLLVSEPIFILSRPEVNAMRLLAKKNSSNYDSAQNNFEDEERTKIRKRIPPKYLMTDELDKSIKNRPGMDLLVYDKGSNHLQIIEQKYKIPIESTSDIKQLDNLLEKGYKQIEEAKEYTNRNKSLILKEYFGDDYEQITPKKVDYFVLTNYSVGTGINTNLPTPILLTDHYIEMMKEKNGMELVRSFLNDNGKKLPNKQKSRYSRFSLLGYKILIPEYLFEISLGDLEKCL
jgi:hypothetical protein